MRKSMQINVHFNVLIQYLAQVCGMLMRKLFHHLRLRRTCNIPEDIRKLMLTRMDRLTFLLQLYMRDGRRSTCYKKIEDTLRARFAAHIKREVALCPHQIFFSFIYLNSKNKQLCSSRRIQIHGWNVYMYLETKEKPLRSPFFLLSCLLAGAI